MSPFVLSVLKYSLLVLLYFFIYRAVKTVAVDVAGRRAPRSAPARTPKPKPAQRGKPPSSVVVHAPDGKKVGSFRLSDAVSIGRSERSTITLDDSYVSQSHARLYARDGAWFVEDLGSTNGTFVNEQKLASPAMFQPGDKVRVGQTIMELRR
ncbi:MAG: FHA domain-containing protein FhaB/FipA [Actinomycetota bacterium]